MLWACSWGLAGQKPWTSLKKPSCEERHKKCPKYVFFGNFSTFIDTWKKGKDPHRQDKIQHLDFTKDPRPLYYKTPPYVFYHNSLCSKAVFGP